MNYCSTGSVSDVRNFQSKLVGLLNTTATLPVYHPTTTTILSSHFFWSFLLGWLMTDIHLQTIEHYRMENFHIFSSGNGWHPLTPLLREKFPRIPNLPFEDQSKHLKGRRYFSGSVFWVMRRNFYNIKYYKKGIFVSSPDCQGFQGFHCHSVHGTLFGAKRWLGPGGSCRAENRFLPLNIFVYKKQGKEPLVRHHVLVHMEGHKYLCWNEIRIQHK